MNTRIIFILLFTSLCGAAQAQKGETSIAAGPLLSFPLATHYKSGIRGRGAIKADVKPGIGLEGQVQHNFSEKSALLLKTTLTSWAYKDSARLFYEKKRLTLLTLQGGYRYHMGSAGYFINGLLGVDIDFHDSFTSGSFTLGVGRRFALEEDRFVEAGIDLVAGDTQPRVNLKVLFSLFR